MNHTIEHDQKYQQFSIKLGEEDAELAYSTPQDKVLDFTHTFVPEEYRGKGIANKLIEEGLQYAEKQGYQVIATCPAVKAYIERHSEYKRLLVQPA